MRQQLQALLTPRSLSPRLVPAGEPRGPLCTGPPNGSSQVGGAGCSEECTRARRAPSSLPAVGWPGRRRPHACRRPAWLSILAMLLPGPPALSGRGGGRGGWRRRRRRSRRRGAAGRGGRGSAAAAARQARPRLHSRPVQPRPVHSGAARAHAAAGAGERRTQGGRAGRGGWSAVAGRTAFRGGCREQAGAVHSMRPLLSACRRPPTQPAPAYQTSPHLPPTGPGHACRSCWAQPGGPTRCHLAPASSRLMSMPEPGAGRAADKAAASPGLVGRLLQAKPGQQLRRLQRMRMVRSGWSLCFPCMTFEALRAVMASGSCNTCRPLGA